MNRTRVMIVDDHQVVRAGLKTLINGQPDLSVVSSSSSSARFEAAQQSDRVTRMAKAPQRSPIGTRSTVYAAVPILRQSFDRGLPSAPWR